MLKIILIVLSMTIFSALGGLYLKRAADSMKSVFSLAVNSNFYIGVIFFCLGAVINIYGLRFISYSIMLPVKSLSYVWTILIAHFFLKETVTKYKILGIISILVGVLFISS